MMDNTVRQQTREGNLSKILKNEFPQEQTLTGEVCMIPAPIEWSRKTVIDVKVFTMQIKKGRGHITKHCCICVFL